MLAYVLLHERKEPPPDLAGWLLFDYEGNTIREREIRLDIDPSTITGIDVKRGKEEMISFRLQDDGTWNLVRGVRDRASRDAVNRLTGFVPAARIVDTIPRAELGKGGVDPASIGLDEAGSIELILRREGQGRLASLRIGRTAPLGNAMYVSVDNNDRRPDIYIVHPDIREFLAAPVDTFRDPFLTKYPSEEIQRFAIRQGEGEIEFSRVFADAPPLKTDPGIVLDAPVPERLASPWVISRPLPNARAYQEGVNDLLGMLAGARVSSFVQAGASPAAPAGADRPIVEISLWSLHPADRKGTTLSFFPDSDPDSRFALCRDRERKAEFRVDRSLVENIALLQDPNVLRDPHLCDISTDRVDTIITDIRGGESAELYRIGGKWSYRPAGGGPFQDASAEAVGRMIRRLNESEVLGYPTDSLTDPAEAGFDAPNITVTFGVSVPPHASLDALTPVSPQTSRTLRIRIAPDGNVFANFAGEPFVYSVGADVPEAIPRELIRWRSLQLPAFSRQQVVRVRQSLGPAPPVEVTADPANEGWRAVRDGEDVTAMLDERSASTLAAHAGSLQVSSWQSPSDASTAALRVPAGSVAVQYRSFSTDTGEFEIREVTIDLAPMNSSGAAPYFYGRHSDLDGIFLIDAPSARKLLTPLLKPPPPEE